MCIVGSVVSSADMPGGRGHTDASLSYRHGMTFDEAVGYLVLQTRETETS
jgi:hypothetical protein